MTSLAVAVLLSVMPLVAGICEDAQLGLYLHSCQPCGSPGLDDMCIKRAGSCSYYNTGAGNTAYGDLGGANGLPPFGYISNANPPTTCTVIKAAAASIPNRAGTTGTIPVYTRAADWGKSWPNIRVNPTIIQFLRILYPTHNCIENSLGFPNGRWNWQNANDARQGSRVDTFFYEDNGNSTWSYQCYCDFCRQCQSCR
uniref:Uncharacterized protein n=1 Tax=Arion vulgaris TaxID=1028688 RepID=A0A0B7AHY4_9EUPU